MNDALARGETTREEVISRIIKWLDGVQTIRVTTQESVGDGTTQLILRTSLEVATGDVTLELGQQGGEPHPRIPELSAQHLQSVQRAEERLFDALRFIIDLIRAVAKIDNPRPVQVADESAGSENDAGTAAGKRLTGLLATLKELAYLDVKTSLGDVALIASREHIAAMAATGDDITETVLPPNRPSAPAMREAVIALHNAHAAMSARQVKRLRDLLEGLLGVKHGRS